MIHKRNSLLRRPNKHPSDRPKTSSTLLLGMALGIFGSYLCAMVVNRNSFHPSVSQMDTTNRMLSQFQTTSSSSSLRSSTSLERGNNDNHDDDGWGRIHVFTGNTSHLPYVSDIPLAVYHHAPWFSQFLQDQLVSTVLKHQQGGFFIDLASNDAVRISNTFALESKYGWNGLCIEPNPVYWHALSYRKCITVAAVIGRTTMEEVQFAYPGKAQAPQGGIYGDQFRNKESNKKVHSTKIPQYTVTLRDIFRKFNVPHVIDYLSLDIEGAETFVMETFPFDQYKFKLLTIEGVDEKLQGILKRQGYKMIHSLRRGMMETLWAHASFLEELDLTAVTTVNTTGYMYGDKRMEELYAET